MVVSQQRGQQEEFGVARNAFVSGTDIEKDLCETMTQR